MKLKHPLLYGLLAASLIVPAAAFAQVQAYTYGGAVVYAGPAPDYPAITQLPDNVPLTVMGCVPGYSWCDVALPNLRGWVYADNLLYPSYPGGPVPLMGYGAAIGVPVVAFSIGSYWGNFYRNQPWYGSQNRWIHHAPPRPIAAPRARPPANYRPQPGAHAPVNAGGRSSAPNGRPPARAAERAPDNAHAPRGNPGPRPAPARSAPRQAPERDSNARDR